ncbi:MAG: heavy-metal-associated domain-containing protein [Flavobacteriaceae bacterium]|nr:heavy-metal-associated domain-containing protein [Flavobacteriaceae bacterium]
MKTLRIVATLIVVTIAFTACKTETKKASDTKIVVAKNPQKLAFSISGMTCEIGCAKTIQSKLSKKEGITTAKVIFKDSLGLVEFDANKISKEDITAFVDGIAGGLYKTSNIKSVATFDEATKK